MMRIEELPSTNSATPSTLDDTIVFIERQAQSVAHRYSERSVQEGERDDVAAAIELEIMLVLGHIDRIRQTHAKAMYRLLELECVTNTKRMNMRPWGYLTGSENTPSHHRLDDRMFKLDMERLRLASTLDDKLRPHHDRLQQLLIKHAVFEL